LQNVTIVVLLVVPALVLLGSLNQNSFADHDTVTKTITNGDNTINYRDITNLVDQADAPATLSLDNGPFIPGENVMVTVTEADANLDLDDIDTISVTATTPSGFNKVVILTETGINTGVFTGIFNLDNVVPPEPLTVTHTPEPIGVGRFSAELTGTGTGGNVDLSDTIIQELEEICLVSGGWDINTHPVNLVFTDDPGTLTGDIAVTLSWANAVDRPVLKDPMSVLYRPFQDPNDPNPPPQWEVLDSENNTPSFKFKSITSTSQPSAIEGQYALATNFGGCFGGGGGGLVRPGQSIAELTLIIGAAVGGELIPVDNVSLVLAYSVVNSWWMAPIVIGIGVGIYLVKRRF